MKRGMQCLWSAVLCLALASPAAAAGAGQFGLALGTQFPMGDFSDAVNTGFGGAVNWDFQLTPVFALGAQFGFQRHGGKLEGTTFEADDGAGGIVLVEITDDHWNVLELTAHGRVFAPTGTARPFAQFGAGLYHLKEDVTVRGTQGGLTASASDSQSESKFGIQAGGGVLMNASPQVDFGLVILYHHIPFEDTSLQYVSASATVAFNFGH